MEPAVDTSSNPSESAVEDRLKVYKVYRFCGRNRCSLGYAVDLHIQLFWPVISGELPKDQQNLFLAKPRALVYLFRLVGSYTHP